MGRGERGIQVQEECSDRGMILFGFRYKKNVQTAVGYCLDSGTRRVSDRGRILFRFRYKKSF